MGVHTVSFPTMAQPPRRIELGQIQKLTEEEKENAKKKSAFRRPDDYEEQIEVDDQEEEDMKKERIEEKLETNTRAFYDKIIFKEETAGRELDSQYFRWQSEIGNVDFGAFVFALALEYQSGLNQFEKDRSEHMDNFLNLLNAVLDELDNHETEKAVALYQTEYVNLIQLAEEFNSMRLTDELHTLKKTFNDKLFRDLVKWATLKVEQTGQLSSVSPLLSLSSWARAFKEHTKGMELETFYTNAAFIRTRDSSYHDVGAKCHQFVMMTLSMTPKILTFNSHFPTDDFLTQIEKNLLRQVNAGEIEFTHDRANELGLTFNYNQTGIRKLLTYRFPDYLTDSSPKIIDTLKHYLVLFNRTSHRLAMIDRLRRQVTDEAVVRRISGDSFDNVVKEFVLTICQFYDQEKGQNLLDLEFLDPFSPDKINHTVSNLVAYVLSDTVRAKVEKDYVDSDEMDSASESDDEDVQKFPGEGRASDDEYESSADFYEEDDFVEVGEDYWDREKTLETKKAIRRNEKVSILRNPNKSLPEEDQHIHLGPTVSLDRVAHLDGEWRPFLETMARDGLSFVNVFKEYQAQIRKENLDEEAFLEKSKYSLTVNFFITQYGERLFGWPDSRLAEAHKQLVSYRERDEEEMESAVFDTAKDAFLTQATLNASPAFKNFLAEIWAFVTLANVYGNYERRADPCQFKPGYHVYRVFVLEYMFGDYMIKYRNGQIVADDPQQEDGEKTYFEALVTSFMRGGYTVVTEGRKIPPNEKKQMKKELFDAITSDENLKQRLEHSPGLSLVDQYWRLLPKRHRKWFKQAAKYLEDELPQVFGSAWWYTSARQKGVYPPWKMGNELFDMLDKVKEKFSSDNSNYAPLFDTAFTKMDAILNRVRKWNLKTELDNATQDLFCDGHDDSIQSMVDKILETVVAVRNPLDDPDVLEDFEHRLLNRIVLFDTPVNVRQAILHYDNQPHLHIQAFEGVNNIVIAIAFLLEQESFLTDAKRTFDLRRPLIDLIEESDSDESDEKNGEKRKREDDDEDDRLSKKARMKSALLRKAYYLSHS
jgi:hypothetical protein